MLAKRESQRILEVEKWFKLLLLMLMAGVLLTITACSSNAPEPSQPDEGPAIEFSTQSEVPSSKIPILEEPQRYEHVIVDVKTDGDGYYCMRSDVEVQFGEYGVQNIFVEEPVLLSFSVSSEHQGGVWVLDLNEGEKVLESLEKIQANLSDEGNSDLAVELASVIEQIEMSGPFTQAST